MYYKYTLSIKYFVLSLYFLQEHNFYIILVVKNILWIAYIFYAYKLGVTKQWFEYYRKVIFQIY